MAIFRIIMGNVSPGWRTSRYMNRQMHDIFFSLLKTKKKIIFLLCLWRKYVAGDLFRST